MKPHPRLKNHDPPIEGDQPPAADVAYLVLQAVDRWSDVFRLSAPAEAVIGRASSGQIVLRSDQASRKHARVTWSGGGADVKGWHIEDLGSRNGTFVNGERLQQPRPLRDGDVIEVAGFFIHFSRTIEGGSRASEGPPRPDSAAAAHATDDQITMEVDPESITDRRRHSRYLHGPPPRHDQVGASGPLLKLAFELARCDSLTDAVETTLEQLTKHRNVDVAGIYAWNAEATRNPPAPADFPLVATRQSGNHGYRRPPESLASAVCSDDGQAILARNVFGDDQLAAQNSRGEYDVESLILAPVRDQAACLRGMIHLTTAGQIPLASDDLEFVVAAAEILAESLLRQSQRKSLDQTIRRSRKQIQQLREQLGDKVRIVGDSEAIGKVVQQITLAAPTGATVLVRGESGVGKELVASAIHHASKRKDGPLVCMNCAALSQSLLESELFGHEKGAFTGATARKHGKFEAADGGTLMLDEIGEMNAEIQAKFLRVLEGHPFERVGGHEPIDVDVRVVAATNRDLQSMVREGLFRQDLYYRLHVIEIIVPPLRQRHKDSLMLADYFLKRFNREMGRKIEGFTPAARKRLLRYPWPGNIRELKNVIERAVVLNTKDVIDDGGLVAFARRPGRLDRGNANVGRDVFGRTGAVAYSPRARVHRGKQKPSRVDSRNRTQHARPQVEKIRESTVGISCVVDVQPSGCVGAWQGHAACVAAKILASSLNCSRLSQ